MVAVLTRRVHVQRLHGRQTAVLGITVATGRGRTVPTVRQAAKTGTVARIGQTIHQLTGAIIATGLAMATVLGQTVMATGRLAALTVPIVVKIGRTTVRTGHQMVKTGLTVHKTVRTTQRTGAVIAAPAVTTVAETGAVALAAA